MISPFFSIVLPACNASQYIGFALDSILWQSYSDFDICLVNDGSSDNTGDICKDYSRRDARIVFIDKKNEGVSVARNKGLEAARGKYILFADADDILYPDALQYLHDYLKDNEVDYLRYEYQTIDENGTFLYPNYEARARKKIVRQLLDAPDCITRIVRNEYFLWSGAFKKEIIDKHHLRFMEGCTYNEDTLFMLQFLAHSYTHVYLPHVFYGYRKYSGAVTAKFTEKNCADVQTVFEKLCGMYGQMDSRMQIVVKPVMETLGLRIYGYMKELGRENEDTIKQLFDFCINRPCLLQWKLMRILGTSLAFSLFPFMDFFNKVIRKFY